MRPDDMENWMLKLADAGEAASNRVFVMRKVLTAAYQQGFEDGHRAARKDDFVRSEIERKATESSPDTTEETP